MTSGLGYATLGHGKEYEFMWTYERRLQYPVKITRCNPKIAQVIISQFGGPDGEMSASMRYLAQRYSMPNRSVAGLLTDIGTEELAHLEIVAAIIHQLTKDLTPDQIAASGFDKYYVDHTLGIWPQAAGGIPFNACEFQVKGDPITDLYEDMAADGTTVQEQLGGKPLKIQDFLLYEFFQAVAASIAWIGNINTARMQSLLLFCRQEILLIHKNFDII